MDAPLLDVTIGNDVGVKDGGLTALHYLDNNNGDDEDDAAAVNSSRRWYVEEEQQEVDGKRRWKVALPPSSLDDSIGTTTIINDDNKKSTAVKYSGLDASLLHLSQIWSRGGANNNAKGGGSGDGGIEQCLPFQGILGIQQGANVAAMLPLLNTANAVYNNQDDGDGVENENRSIFDGLQFVILVDGSDIMCQELQVVEEDVNKDQVNKENDNTTNQTEEEEEDWYVGPNGIESLHVIAETNQDSNATAITNKRNSELLAKRYGPNATIQYYKPTKKKSSSSSSPSNNKMPTMQQQQQQQRYNHNQLTSPSLHNILGKYLVHQKNTFHSNPQKRKLLQLQHQLCHVEQLASVMITEEVRRNPPKCLMAMIGPAAASADGEGDSKNEEDEKTNDSNNNISNNHKMNGGDETTTNTSTVKAVVGKTVGAWQGPGRVPGEQGGGAPCPETFLLRQEERRKNNAVVVVASHDVILADEKSKKMSHNNID